MKRTFNLIHPKKKIARMVEAVKNDVRKYVKRERRKDLPKGVDFWDFDCKFGDTEAEAQTVHLAELDKKIDDAEERGLESFYIEILAKDGNRTKKPKEPFSELPEEFDKDV